MLLPNAITLTVLIAGYLLIHIQVRLEEEFLSGKHGESYTHYKSKVKRFL
ncbi:MAG TPA: methyltransferase family protein [Candidatus Wunengus sp. YC63]